MNSIIRAASRLASLSVRPMSTLVLKPKPQVGWQLAINKRWAHNQPLTYDSIRERILLILRLFDKVDPNKLTLESHFVNDLGLDSLDHVEIIMMIEDEFYFEIPDKDAEKLLRPIDIITYLSDKEEAYEELQKLHAEHHHGDHGHGHNHGHGHEHGHEGQHHNQGAHGDSPNRINTTSKRGFATWSTIPRRYKSDYGEGYITSFERTVKDPPEFDDIQKRVMKVCSKYDKIDSSKLHEASHFVDDLGLDSLDHVEIIMELEDEFGHEIPDKDAEKLMRPAEIARYIFEKESKARIPEPKPRHF